MKYQQRIISGPALRFARRRVGLNQVTLARRLQVTPATVADWERGKRDIPTARYEAIGAAILAARMDQARCERGETSPDATTRRSGAQEG